MADFAKAQLMKYGWTEGKGLGKNESGITEAIKPKLKFDTAGVGHKENWNEWWETAFNKAANSITIESQSNGVSISISKEDRTNGLFKEKPKQMYGNFLKTSTLYGDSLVQESNCDEAEVENLQRDVIHTPLTDEELFKACGGRTAHKGARHGLKLNGKLERIAEQEKKLLCSGTFRSTSDRLQNQDEELDADEYEIDNNANTILPLVPSTSEEPSSSQASKSTMKKNRRRINDLTHQLHTLCNMNDCTEDSKKSTVDDTRSKKKTKFKRRRSKDRKESSFSHKKEDIAKQELGQEICDIPLPMNEEMEKGGTKKKKVCSQITLDKSIDVQYHEQTADHNEIGSDCTSVVSTKKKKSKRKRSQSCQNTSTTAMQLADEGMHAPKSKKSKKSHNKKRKELDFLIRDEDSNMVEFKSEIDSPCKETPLESNKVRNSSPSPEKYDILDFPNTFSKREADRLNARIKKKKQIQFHKKEKNKLDRITERLEAVHFDTEQSGKTINVKKRLDTVVDTLMADDITENKTATMKKLLKKNKKSKKKDKTDSEQ